MRTTHFVPVEGDESVAVDWYVPNGEAASRTAVFVHGFGSDRRGDKAIYFAEEFGGAGWNFCSVDLRGHGDSDGSMETLTLSGCLADLGAVMDWAPRGANAPVLIGSSMGGAVSGWYHILNPGRVAAIAMIAPSLDFPTSFGESLGEETLARWRREGVLNYDNQWLEIKLGYGLIEDGKQFDLARLYSEWSVPAVIFHGMLDDAVPWESSLKFLQGCPFSALHLLLIKNGDHRLTDFKAYMLHTMLAWLSEHLP